MKTKKFFELHIIISHFCECIYQIIHRVVFSQINTIPSNNPGSDDLEFIEYYHTLWNVNQLYFGKKRFIYIDTYI